MPLSFDPYELLGVPKNASQDDIKKAYKKKAFEYHPDKTNGDKDKEEIFKHINESYSILSDQDKRKLYDLGMLDGDPANMGPNSFEMNFEDIFGGFGFPFGGFNMQQSRPKQRGIDVINVTLTINDLYYGTSKKVEFEMLDKCAKCNGTGANDPSQVIKCMKCNGTGMFQQRISPFMFSAGTCPSCQGKGEMRTGKACQACKGEKTCYKKRAFELKLPKGGGHQSEMVMQKKGSYNKDLDENNDIVFKFNYDIPPNYKVNMSNGNVEYVYKLTIDQLLSGFEDTITIYNEKFTLKSESYFNPSKSMCVNEKGLFHPKLNKNGDLYIKFDVEFTDGDKLVKYKDVFHKIYKRQQQEEKTKSIAEKGMVIVLS